MCTENYEHQGFVFFYILFIKNPQNITSSSTSTERGAHSFKNQLQEHNTINKVSFNVSVHPSLTIEEI